MQVELKNLETYENVWRLFLLKSSAWDQRFRSLCTSFASNFMIPLLHKSIKKNWKFKSLGDLWVRERSFFLSFFLFFAVLSRGKKNSTHFPRRFHQVLLHYHHQLGCSCRTFLSSRFFLERDRIGLENLRSEIQCCTVAGVQNTVQ